MTYIGKLDLIFYLLKPSHQINYFHLGLTKSSVIRKVCKSMLQYYGYKTQTNRFIYTHLFIFPLIFSLTKSKLSNEIFPFSSHRA